MLRTCLAAPLRPAGCGGPNFLPVPSPRQGCLVPCHLDILGPGSHPDLRWASSLRSHCDCDCATPRPADSPVIKSLRVQAAIVA
eukprot:1090234-Alexandrium_andersonii.AAC.1